MKNYKFAFSLITAVFIGSLIGIFFQDFGKTLAPLGQIYMNLMFMIVVPLVFLSVTSAVSSFSSLKRLGKIMKSLLLVFVTTGLIAAVIMIISVRLVHPAEGVNIPLSMGEEQKLNLGEALVSTFTVSDFSQLLSRNNILPLILFSIFFGFCTIKCDKEGKLAKGLELLNQILMTMIKYVMYYAPIGIGCFFANLVATYGPELMGSYAKAMAIYYPVSILYYIIAFYGYSCWSTGSRKGPKLLFKNILDPSLTSLATCSSIATIPVNLRTTEKIGVPKDIADIVLPLGATAHMDGTCLSSILKISFLFGIFGKDFAGAGTMITAAVIAVVAGVVMSGVPGGGLIGEMLICSIYGFPPEAFPIIATIGFLVDPPATMLNATGDTVASMMVSRLVEGKEWYKKTIIKKEP